MLARVMSGTTIGLDGVLISVEVDVAGRGFPTFTIVGLPGKAVDEAKDRVRTAIANTSFEMPDSRITVNLAPADIPKTGSAFDLPIAIGILAASGMIEIATLSDSLFIGELSLEGNIQKVPGVLSIVAMAKERQFQHIYFPKANIPEAVLIEGTELYPLENISDLVLHLNGHKKIEPYVGVATIFQEPVYDFDFADIKGQETAKRALEIAAAGFHNIHLKGPPGTGKTLLSRAFPSILPRMSKEEIVEVSKIYSIAGFLDNTFFSGVRPFRSPHHTTSRIGLIGGGSHPTPGEISLAHRGVLFLDEFPEFPRSVIEALRQPLEDGFITVSRAAGSLTFPSRFILVAASNPCPCGYLGHVGKSCRCMPGTIMRYKKRLSGPMLDRIDMHVTVPSLSEDKLASGQKGESSAVIYQRVTKAQKLQKKRVFDKKSFMNGELPSSLIKEYCPLTDAASGLLKKAVERLSLSPRSYFKTIKVARTIADLACSDLIDIPHIAEGLQYRAADE